LRQLGPQDPNAIYFVNSKQRGSGVCRALLHDADGDVPQAKHVAASGRIVVQYDASCPAEQRRFIEWLLGNTGQGVSVIATSAMEVGVDFDHLDICCMDELPLTSKELLQRIGRVGRTAGRPGIVIFNADSVLGSDIEDNPKRALRYDPGTPVIPTDLELIRFKHLCALSFELHDRKSSAYDAVVERFVQPVFHVGNLRFMETIAPRASELGIPRGLASESRLDHGSWFRGSLRSAAREVRVFAGWAAIGREDAGIALRRVPPGGLYHRQGETYCVPAWLDGVVRPGELTQLDRIDVVRSKVQGRSQVRIDTAVKFTDDSGGILAGRRWISGSAQVTQLLRTIVNQFEDGRSERVKLPDAPCGYTYETRGLRLPVDIACEQPLPRYGLESLLECFVAHGLGVSPNDLVVRLVTTNARAANISHINEIQLLDGGISANGVTHHAGRHPACLVKGLELCVKSLAGSDRVRRATLALVDPFTAIQHGSGIDQAVIATCKAMLDACAQAVRR
jgi:hypothetical protein